MHGRGGGMHGRGVMRGRGGACVALGGVWQGGCMAGGDAWQERRPLQRAVHILLECFLVDRSIYLAITFYYLSPKL